jgi:SAM-dependent methyltransferase
MIEPNYISYRDSAARVVTKIDGYYRYIFNEYKAEYEHLMQSGLYEELTQNGLLIEHQEKPLDTRDPNVYKLLYPTQIAFQSYPFEWSNIQWRKAILAYLKINLIALKYGMILKDATPYNFYFNGGKAINFDTSSFMFFKENDSWIAYRQFCEEFLSTIVLMHYNGSRWSKLTMAHFREMPLNFVSKQLPFKSWFNLTTLLHIHLHSKYSGKNGPIKIVKTKKRGFSKEKIKSLQKMILKQIIKWETAYQYNNHWENYYEQNIESATYLAHKENTIKEWLEKTKPKSVLDLGANTGKFSFIAANYSPVVIALEDDDNCVDAIEKEIQKKKLQNVYTLTGNLAKPSPCLGLLNSATESIYKRGYSEIVLALALTHHLHFTNKLSFDLIGELLNKFSSKYVIVEFIEKEDSKVQFIINDKTVELENYTLENFKNSMYKLFKINNEVILDDSKRILLLLEKSLYD